jgi:hypothetical protein
MVKLTKAQTSAIEYLYNVESKSFPHLWRGSEIKPYDKLVEYGYATVKFITTKRYDFRTEYTLTEAGQALADGLFGTPYPDPTSKTEDVAIKIRNEGKVVAQVNREELVAVEQRLWSATELVKPRFGETRLRYADINGHKVHSPKTSPSRDLQGQKGIRPANMQKKAKTPISSQNTISYADALRAQYRKAGSVRIGVAS